jgi:uncharacterized protein with PQ loop repeat
MVELAKSSSESKKLIDKLIYIAAIAYPLTTVPQIVDLFISKSSENVSLLTWLLYDAFTFIFLWYAIEKKLKPLIIEYCMWIVAQTIVVLLILLYR